MYFECAKTAPIAFYGHLEGLFTFSQINLSGLGYGLSSGGVNVSFKKP